MELKKYQHNISELVYQSLHTAERLSELIFGDDITLHRLMNNSKYEPTIKEVMQLCKYFDEKPKSFMPVHEPYHAEHSSSSMKLVNKMIINEISKNKLTNRDINRLITSSGMEKIDESAIERVKSTVQSHYTESNAIDIYKISVVLNINTNSMLIEEQSKIFTSISKKNEVPKGFAPVISKARRGVARKGAENISYSYKNGRYQISRGLARLYNIKKGDTFMPYFNPATKQLLFQRDENGKKVDARLSFSNSGFKDTLETLGIEELVTFTLNKAESTRDNIILDMVQKKQNT